MPCLLGVDIGTTTIKAVAMDKAAHDQAMHARTAALSHRIAAEDGVGEAVKATQEFLA